LTPAEQILIDQCLAADVATQRNGQRKLYDKYSRRMYAVCLRYVSTTFEAEDIMIGGLMKVFNNLARFEGKGSFEGWIRRIMVNEALMHLRKEKGLFAEPDTERAAREPDYDHLNQVLECDDLLELVQRLPNGYRTVFNLYAIEGYSHKEIGEALGISENTSKSQLSRARALLQSKLAEVETDLRRVRL
jgi:RNA polymerase sigma factor (sigma-70 family)